jgi:ABC-type nitrate/sulfonate/bicarbonate transport system permease component
MRQALRRIGCAIAIVALLGLPASGQAQSIADSVSKLSNADIHRVLQQPASANHSQPIGRQAGITFKSVAKGAATGAAIGLLSGLVAGAMINRYCHNEGASCGHVVVKLSMTGLGLGAAIGAGAAAGR